MIDDVEQVDTELLELTISVLGSPFIDVPEFPPPNSKLIIDSQYALRVATPEAAPNKSPIIAPVDLDIDGDGHLRAIACKQVLELRAIADGAPPRSKRRKSQPQAPKVAMATLAVDPYDGSLCSNLRKVSASIHMAAVLGPYLNLAEDGSLSLVFAAALRADSTVPVRSRQALALQFLARALDDPTLNDPLAFQAGPVDMLHMITQKPSENPPGIRPRQMSTSLLPYQRDSVNWCLRREGKALVGESEVEDLDPQIRDYVVAPPLGWRQVPGSEIWVNPYELRTSSTEPTPAHVDEFAGRGLLAEEMGLGKTLEMTSLMLLNPRKVGDGEYASDPITGQQALKIKATLVIAPKSILTQWKHELALHAPHLKVIFYQGHEQGTVSIEDLTDVDVVLTSYVQLSLEVYNAVYNPNKRSTRYNSFKRPEIIEANRSKLVQVQFWRVILDEAQMVHTGASSAALVARLVPRVHAWAVTGTPVKRSLEDLRGLLYFLDMRPFVARQCWQRLIASPIDLERTMHLIGMRHTKPLVAHQLFIPQQHRKLILLKFSEVERLRYDRLVQRFEEEDRTANVNLNSWLMRLRQACSHATSGSQSSSDVLLTIDQVLGQLVDEADAAVYVKYREKIVLELEKGQLLDKADKLRQAIKVWSHAFTELKDQLAVSSERLSHLTETADKKQAEADELEKNLLPDDVPEISLEPDVSQLQKENLVLDAKHAATVAQNQVKSARARRKTFQELLHRTMFFIGTGNFRLSQRLVLKLEKENVKVEHFDQATQDELKRNSSEESHYYELAEQLRTEILGEAADRVEQVREKIKAPVLRKVAKICNVRKAEIVDDLGAFAMEMTEQLLDILNQPLMEEKVDEAKPGHQVENDAYAKTLDLQEYAFSLLDTLQVILRDRAAAINGGTVQNMNPELDDDFSAKLVARREEIVPLLRHDRTPLVSTMRISGVDANIIDELKGEVPRYQRFYGTLRDLYNSRVEYYKQLQELSDQVMDIDTPASADINQLVHEKELSVARTVRSMDALLSRQRYVRNLEGANHRQSQARSETTEVCPICQDHYTVGSLGPCGHTFCFDCLHKWLSVKATCPLCKRHTLLAQVVTFKIGDESEGTRKSEEPQDAKEEIASEIFSPITDTYYNRILREPIERMYGIKIDMIVRHMKHLRSEDPTAQVIVFSQWQSMLRVLRSALNENGIRAASMSESATRVDEFRDDSRVACLLLHAKADVAGLTLVNANHVYLCEPFLNTALELQAISRVNRIGQTRETIVWQFCVENTVEQTILGMTTKQRLLETAAVGMDSADSSTLAEAQAQGSLVDRRSGAEIVGDNVIREILFKKKKNKSA